MSPDHEAIVDEWVQRTVREALRNRSTSLEGASAQEEKSTDPLPEPPNSPPNPPNSGGPQIELDQLHDGAHAPNEVHDVPTSSYTNGSTNPADKVPPESHEDVEDIAMDDIPENKVMNHQVDLDVSMCFEILINSTMPLVEPLLSPPRMPIR